MSGEEYKRLRDYSEDHQQTITDTIKEGVFLLYMTYDWKVRFSSFWKGRSRQWQIQEKTVRDEYCEQEKQFEAMACISTVTLIHMESEDIYICENVGETSTERRWANKRSVGWNS